MIAGISVAGVVGSLLLAFVLYAGIYKRKKVRQASLLPAASEDQQMQPGQGNPFGFVWMNYIQSNYLSLIIL